MSTITPPQSPTAPPAASSKPFAMPAEPPPGYYGKRIPQVLDHEYDGIREFDNPTPGWWHLLWVVTIVFSFFYILFWHFSPLADTPQTAWARNQTREYQKLFGTLGELRPDEPTIIQMMGNAQMQQVAQGIFETNCAACHAKDGGGINGVNLTDDHFKNAKKLEDLYTVITNGANNGAMPAWRNRLSENERIIVAAYAAKLRGTTAKAPRGAEGDVIPPWPAAPAENPK